MISQRLAPMAARTAISGRRREARVSISPATLAQAISKRKTTEANSTPNAGRVLPTRSSNSGVTIAAVNFLLVSGYCDRQILRDDTQIGVSLRDRDSRLQPADDGNHVGAALCR